ncbi:MAG: hypothetical protein M3179_14225 [Actinomycetota bacterium]|nr:hypothetical protein [Actinomycetota bacterium]
MNTPEGTRRRTRPVVVAALAALAALGAPLLPEAIGHAATSTIGTWELTAPLSVPRYDHTTTLLANGKVLAAGGRTSPAGTIFNSAEVYDPITERWTPTGPMNDFRWRHTATLLPDGRVLVAGGFTGTTGNNAQPVLNSAEIYDPTTNTWTRTGSMNVRRALHSAVLLPDGKVLVAGGRWCPNAPPATCDFTFRTATAELYDPSTGTWTPTGNMNQARHTTTAVLLQNGLVLVPGGFTDNGNGFNGDLYNPATGTWVLTGNLNFPRGRQGGMLLQDGRVLVALGFPANQSTELYDPNSNTWSFAGNLTGFTSRFNFNYGVMPNGKAVVAGGQTNPPSMVTNRSDLFDPATNQWTTTAPMNEPHGSGSSLANSDPMVILSASPTSYVADPAVCGRHCGKAMVAGNSPSGSVELFTAPNTCFGFNATIIGTEGADNLVGTRGRDVIIGLGGDDRITASYGNDIVCGGEGNDFIAGGYNNDIVLGEAGSDQVSGAEGNDFLFGEGEADRLTGGPGTDTADGGASEGDICFASTVRNCP